MQIHEGSCVILFDREGRVLLQQRDDDIPPAGVGRWTIPGGGREGDESPRKTALREFEEETGIALERLRFFETLDHESPRGGRSTTHLFFSDDEVARERIVVNEGMDFQYFAPDDALALPMNPQSRERLERFFASDKYRGTVATKAAFRVGVGIIEIDRWGRLLLQLRDADLPPERFPDTWCIPGGLLEAGEPPDAAALREFEEETGHLLQELKLFRVYRRAGLATLLSDIYHVYYVDADIPEQLIDVNEGQAFRYFAPGELAELEIPPHARTVLDEFVVSPAYKAMFH
jgi:8-oxo-dGTP diphosphatase